MFRHGHGPAGRLQQDEARALGSSTEPNNLATNTFRQQSILQGGKRRSMLLCSPS